MCGSIVPVELVGGGATGDEFPPIVAMADTVVAGDVPLDGLILGVFVPPPLLHQVFCTYNCVLPPLLWTLLSWVPTARCLWGGALGEPTTGTSGSVVFILHLCKSSGPSPRYRLCPSGGWVVVRQSYPSLPYQPRGPSRTF